MVVGTVGYIPPEQVQRKGADHRAKFFAFGVILFEMLLTNPCLLGMAS